ncbi:MAG: TonB-dependent receptor [Fluviicola sp.]|jgi:iron complex outermembrane receptor protein|uniref:TonB-dependent receptor n=1 Tax=Fluviicola sp. TaxID=1917219 RepID=UPI0026171D77|nr:TonB-dependent receptor [Fluviicola sp.]MDF3027206.1 TonB-dependent receptor [Fluviicola sp.]
MKKAGVLVFIAMSCACMGHAQNDSIRTLGEVTVNAYPSKPLLLHSASSVSIIGQEQIRDYTNQSLVPVMNSVPGVRMEERSPGSYRLSIRGSLLRSPFGIRNVKIYLDEFPLTDAGGNTYLNLINAGSIHAIQIIKGPDGSMFGANTGGVILLDPENRSDSAIAGVSIKTGSYGLFDEQLSFDKKWKRYSLSIDQSYQRSDGYRENSALQRNYLHAIQKWNYKKGSVKLLLLGSHLHYETPGGLTLLQAEANPRQARLATATLPGASEQKAGIYNTTAYAGISNEFHFSPIFKHVLTLFGSYTDFKNPFITNYETRKEQSSGVRTYFELGKKWTILDWKWDLGVEWQQTKSRIANYDNNSGSKGELQASDNLKVTQNFIFTQFSLLINKRLGLEAALSLNQYFYHFKNTFPDPQEAFTRRELTPQFMPRAGISYRIIRQLVWRASVSKGYSPPTLAEIRPSNNTIYSDLQSESGWNYETGFRFKSLNHRWYGDVAVFRFDLQQAIVRRVDDNGVEYFVNAGGTNQTGLELQLSGELVRHQTQGFIRGLDVQNSFTYSDFTFTNYSIDAISYSGNKLTGVPKFVNVTSLKLFFPLGFSLFFSDNYTDKIPLNDGNSAYASSYHLFCSKLNWEYRLKNNIRFQVFAGVENILDVFYSLGNDLNAAGGRYYNPAPGRTYYFGIQLRI